MPIRTLEEKLHDILRMMRYGCGTNFRMIVTWCCGVFLLLPSAIMAASAPSAQIIMQKSVAATQQDWDQAPKYSFTDREVVRKRGHAQPTKTNRVLMIDGSPYNKLLAINDAPLSEQQQQKQDESLQRETRKRDAESAADRQRRMSEYLRERNRDHAMLTEMTKAFQYALVGEDAVDGHKVWVLKATPKPDYVPHNREGKVLRHMQGNMWVDQSTYQWVKVEAQVVAPVSMYGFLAQVKPGTKFELEQAPVGSGLWLPKRFVVTVNATALGILNENSYDEDDYSDYKPVSGKNGS